MQKIYVKSGGDTLRVTMSSAKHEDIDLTGASSFERSRGFVGRCTSGHHIVDQ